MVIRERKLVSIEVAERLIKESSTPEEAVERLRSLPKRQKAPPPPEGGISLRDAERKYSISYSVLSRWAKRGWVKVLKKVPNWLYLDEKDLIRALKEHGRI